MAIKQDFPKLYRSEGNKIVTGVCGGLGEYLNIDPIILRIILVLITVFGGSGLFIYIILWIFIPSKSTLGKKSEDYIKENVNDIKNKSENAVKNGNGRAFIGILLIVFGTTFLLENLGFYMFHNIWRFWPIALIALGLSILSGKSKQLK